VGSNLVDVVLGCDVVEDGPQVIDQIDGLNRRHLGHDQSEVVDDDKRHRRFDKQLRFHSHTGLQALGHWPVIRSPTNQTILN